MILSVNGSVVNTPMPLFRGEEIVVAIDSSKTNTAIAVSGIDGKEQYIELYGKNDGTSKEDTLALCKTHRETLKVLFEDTKIKLVGIEDIITTDTERKQVGISIHMSRFKITAVFMSLITFFQDTFGITPELINNQTWKASTLPAEFCKRTYDKGSLAYFKSINSKYQYCSDDVTDAICILRYLKKIHSIEDIIPIDSIEVCTHEYKYAFVPISKNLGSSKQFRCDTSLQFKQNVAFMANRCDKGKLTYAKVLTKDIPLEVLIGKCVGNFNEREEIILLVVYR